MDEKQWLGDLWGVSKETWFEIWVNAVPAVLGGLFTLAVALLIFRLERAKEQRRAWAEANLDLIDALGGIAQRGLKDGPQFESAEVNRLVQRWAITSPFSRNRASHLTAGILKWLGVWRSAATDTQVEERSPQVPYRRDDYLHANAEFFYELLTALHTMDRPSPLKRWTFYERCYSGTRDILNMRFALAVIEERTGTATASVTHVLPRPWNSAVRLANRFGLYPSMFIPARTL